MYLKIYTMVLTIIITVLLLMNLKWIIIAMIFPFQVINAKRCHNEFITRRRLKAWYILSLPYLVWERWIMKDGWQRYMLFQIGTVPSNHFRKWIYKCLGAKIEKDVVFHFKTEVRSPERLFVRGGYHNW